MKRLILFTFTLLSALSLQAQELIPAEDKGKWGYKRADGHWVIDPTFENARTHSEGLAAVKKGGKYGFINAYGEVVINYRFEDTKSFSDGLVAVKLMGKWGFIDKTGASRINYRFDEVYNFENGLAAVKMNGKFGFVNPQGEVVIPYQYDMAKGFSEGLAMVRMGSREGYIDRYGKWYATKEEYIPLFSDYARASVEKQIEEWQKKGKYEKTVDWQARVNEQTRAQKVSELTKKAEGDYLAVVGKQIGIGRQRLDAYDADNEVFLIKDDHFGDLLVPVPIDDAPRFEEEFYTMGRSVRHFIDEDKLALAELSFRSPTTQKVFTYNNSASVDYFIANVDYQFAPIEIDKSVISRMERGEQNIRRGNSVMGPSDVDIDIPIAKSESPRTFALIIANENYKHEDNVPFAAADGESFRNYCLKTLGLEEEHINFYPDASLNEIRMGLNWMRDISEAYASGKERAKFIFYYSGHGIPSESGDNSYLLPVDGSGRDAESGYDLSRLYHQLGAMPAESVTVLLDACFSGTKREGDMITAARGVALAPEPLAPTLGNLIIFSATQGDQTAMMHPKKGHGLFTYFLLKKLQEEKGNVTLGELVEYVTERVQQESVVTNRKKQTPNLTVAPALRESWSGMQLK